MVENYPSIDFSPRDDYQRCLGEYDDNSIKCSKRVAAFFESDQMYKNLQKELYDLLCNGDDLWDELRACSSNSSAQRKCVSNLQKSIEQMHINLGRQEDSIKEVDSTMRKAVRQMEKTNDNVDGLKEQVKAIRRNLEDRVTHMCKLEPELARKKLPSSSSSSKRRGSSPHRSSAAAYGGA